jgi:prepilin-type N-terminal cleavage/methylation domain-containing protein
MRKAPYHVTNAGFTLVELLIVVVIIGILAGIAIPQFAAYRMKAYCAVAKSDLGNYAVSEEAYFTEYNSYTTAISGAGIPGFVLSPKVTLTHDAAKSSPSLAGFTVSASHTQCDENNNGAPDFFTWDSTNGGMQ